LASDDLLSTTLAQIDSGSPTVLAESKTEHEPPHGAYNPKLDAILGDGDETMEEREALIDGWLADEWHKYDTDGSGSLAKSEAEPLVHELWEAAGRPWEATLMDDLFAEIDTDHSGKITKDEWRTFTLKMEDAEVMYDAD